MRFTSWFPGTTKSLFSGTRTMSRMCPIRWRASGNSKHSPQSAASPVKHTMWIGPRAAWRSAVAKLVCFRARYRRSRSSQCLVSARFSRSNPSVRAWMSEMWSTRRLYVLTGASRIVSRPAERCILPDRQRCRPPFARLGVACLPLYAAKGPSRVAANLRVCRAAIAADLVPRRLDRERRRPCCPMLVQ